MPDANFVTPETFAAHVQRLDAADAYRDTRLDSHIAEYRREQNDMKLQLLTIRNEMVAMDDKMNIKLDELLANKAQLKGRDGVILVIIGAAVSIMVAVITASILGYI